MPTFLEAGRAGIIGGSGGAVFGTQIIQSLMMLLVLYAIL